MIDATTIKTLIEQGLTQPTVIVAGDDGAHFRATVICQQFSGCSRLERERLVLNTVSQYLLDGSLHALSIRAFTPGEWEAHSTK